MRSSHKVFSGIIAVCSLLFAAHLGLSIGEGNLGPTKPLWIGMAIFACYAIREWLPVLVLGIPLFHGRGAFFGGFGYWDMVAVALIGLWLLDLALRRSHPRRMMGRLTFLCVCCYTLPLVWHLVRSRVGLGPQSEGGVRLAVVSMVTVVVCALLLSGQLSLRKIRWLPIVGLMPGVALLLIDAVNLAIPKSVYITAYLYDAQNWENIMSTVTGGRVEVLRSFYSFRELTVPVALLGVCYFAVSERLGLWPLLVAATTSVIGLGMGLLSGYRLALVRLIATIVPGAWVRSWLLGLGLVVLMCGGLATVIYVHHEIMAMPRAIQRTVCWWPGDWDPEVQLTAEEGLAFRERLWSRFFSVYFPDNWCFGRGHIFFGEDLRAMGMRVAPSPGLETALVTTDNFALTQDWHSGLVTTLDFVGVFGCFFLALASARGLWNCRIIMGHRFFGEAWIAWLVLSYISIQVVFWPNEHFSRLIPFLSVTSCMLEFIRDRFGASVGGASDLSGRAHQLVIPR